MYAVLGEVEFDLITYFDGMEARFGSDYAEHARIGAKPVLQFVGDKLDEVSISLVFHASYCDPEAELSRLKRAQQAHTSLALVLGNGDYKGRFVITDLTATGRHTDRMGRLMAVDAQMSLKEFTGKARRPLAPAVGLSVKPGTMPVNRTPLAKLADTTKAKQNTGGLSLAVTQAKSALATTADVLGVVRGLKGLAGRDPLAVMACLPGVMRNAQGVLPNLGLAADSIKQFEQLASTASDAGKLSRGLTEIKGNVAALPGLLSGANAGNLTNKLSMAEGAAESSELVLARLSKPLATLAAKSATRSALS